MYRKITLITVAVLLVGVLTGCQAVNAVGCVIRGAGNDLVWAGEQVAYLGKGQLYYAEIGGKRIYFRKVNSHSAEYHTQEQTALPAQYAVQR